MARRLIEKHEADHFEEDGSPRTWLNQPVLGKFSSFVFVRFRMKKIKWLWFLLAIAVVVVSGGRSKDLPDRRPGCSWPCLRRRALFRMTYICCRLSLLWGGHE